jgi:hypothetical protein
MGGIYIWGMEGMAGGQRKKKNKKVEQMNMAIYVSIGEALRH